MGDLSANFDSKETACKCGCGLKYPSPLLVHLLQIIRDIAQAPVTIESGWRCTKRNQTVSKVLGKQGATKGQCGDSTASAHTRGEAADINIKGYTKEQAYALVRKIHDGKIIPELQYCYIIGGSKANIHVGVDVQKRNSIWGGTQ